MDNSSIISAIVLNILPENVSSTLQKNTFIDLNHLPEDLNHRFQLGQKNPLHFKDNLCTFLTRWDEIIFFCWCFIRKIVRIWMVFQIFTHDFVNNDGIICFPPDINKFQRITKIDFSFIYVLEKLNVFNVVG